MENDSHIIDAICQDNDGAIVDNWFYVADIITDEGPLLIVRGPRNEPYYRIEGLLAAGLRFVQRQTDEQWWPEDEDADEI